MAENATVRALLEATKDAARRRHHPVARAAHVIEVLFTSPGMDRRVRKLGLDADHLRDAAMAALDAMPAITGYRDAARAELCPSVVQAAENARHLIEYYGIVEIVPALQTAPDLRDAFRAYELDQSIVQRVQRGTRGRDCADALAFLLGEHIEIAALLSDAGLDPEDLTTKCGRAWGDLLAPVVEAARGSGYAALEPATLIGYLVREVAVADGYELPAIGDALDILFHGPPSDDAAPDDRADAEVVFLNDPMTPFETVFTILRETFGMGEDEAYDLTLAIDARDSAVAARTRGADARELAQLATKQARREGHPLRVFVRGRA